MDTGQVKKHREDVYNQFSSKSTQVFVLMQRLYVDLANLYYRENIKEYINSTGHMKEFEAITNMLQSSPACDERLLKGFIGLWKTANETKHANKDISFEENYVRYCISVYNKIVNGAFSEASQTDILIDLSKLKTKQESSISLALKKALVSKQDNESIDDRHENIISSNLIVEAYEKLKLQNLKVFDCPQCTTRLIYKTGRYGPYYQCSKCDFKENEKKFLKSIYSIVDFDNEKTWVISRPRCKNSKTEFLQSIAVPDSMFAQINLGSINRDDLKRFSHWRIDCGYPQNKPNKEIKTVISLTYKILTRGRITLSSYQINKKFGKTDANGFRGLDSFDFIAHSTEQNKPIDFWLDSHGTEQKFYQEYLPKIAGNAFFSYVIPQADLKSLTGLNQEVGDQRVDFAVNDGFRKIVIEIDDPAHKKHKESDNARDNMLVDCGYKVIRIPNSEIFKGDGDKLRELRDCFVDYRKKPEIKEVQKEIIIFKLIHQIQIATVKALLNGGLGKDSRIYVDTAEKLFSANERQNFVSAAVDDLNLLLNNVAALCSMPQDFIIESCTDVNDADYIISFDQSKKPESNLSIITNIVYAQDFINYPVSYSQDIVYDLNQKNLEYFLQYIFRKPSFLEGQYDVICNALKKKDSIVLLPTGAGKSIAFQLAGLLSAGVTMVISPLLALMDDQIDNLQRSGVDRVVKIASDIDVEKKEELLDAVSQGDYHTIYIAPERMQISSFQNTLETVAQDITIPLFVIDEAHCLSEWGHDFRTSYLNLGRIIRTKCSVNSVQPTILALTGTASNSVLTDVKLQLDIYDDDAIIYSSTFDRENLHYSIVHCQSTEKMDVLEKNLRMDIPAHFGETPDSFYALNGVETYCGIVFCPHVNGDYGVSMLYNKFESKYNYNCGYFSGKKPDNYFGDWNIEKKKQAQKFKNNQCALLFATSAYGMGIDKPNIRYVIHHNMPKSVESYYQEVGRAGRYRSSKGQQAPAECIMIASIGEDGIGDHLAEPYEQLQAYDKKSYDQEDDVDRVYFFHGKSFKGEKVELAVIKHVLEKIKFDKKTSNYDFSDVLSKISEYFQKGKSNESNKTTKENPSDYKVDIEKAIYRLLLLGVISDYLKVKNNEYTIVVNVFNRKDIKESYTAFIKKYNPQRVSGEIKALEELDSSTQDDKEFILKAAKMLLAFNYSIIERGRAEQIRLMYDIIKTSKQEKDPDKQDSYIRKRVLQILSVSERDTINSILDAPNSGFNEIIQLFSNLSYERRKSINGQARRELESHPDHPGILFIGALDLLDQHEIDFLQFGNRVESAILNAREKYNVDGEVLTRFFSWFLTYICDIIIVKFGYQKYDDFYETASSGFDNMKILEWLSSKEFYKPEAMAPVVRIMTKRILDESLKIIKRESK